MNCHSFFRQNLLFSSVIFLEYHSINPVKCVLYQYSKSDINAGQNFLTLQPNYFVVMWLSTLNQVRKGVPENNIQINFALKISPWIIESQDSSKQIRKHLTSTEDRMKMKKHLGQNNGGLKARCQIDWRCQRLRWELIVVVKGLMGNLGKVAFS